MNTPSEMQKILESKFSRKALKQQQKKKRKEKASMCKHITVFPIQHPSKVVSCLPSSLKA